MGSKIAEAISICGEDSMLLTTQIPCLSGLYSSWNVECSCRGNSIYFNREDHWDYELAKDLRAPTLNHAPSPLMLCLDLCNV